MTVQQSRGALWLWRAFLKRISLLEDKADDLSIDREVRNSVEMRGTNLWVLMAAIFIASIGLNVNSTAVVIGAMLISPLMGPIVAIGYGVGILDLALIRNALKNLSIAMAIALGTSTLYFLLSPLNTADSELLARTTPTIWDVLIALFGGFAGIIGVTRKEKSNIVPGVAIATALMPPLCTAGYGIAHANWSFIGGAFFLFAINCVFIACSAGIVVRAFHVKQTRFVDPAVAARVRRYVTAVVVLTLLPSAYFAYRMVQQEVFRVRAEAFVAAEVEDSQVHVAQISIKPGEQKIELTLVGQHISTERQSRIVQRLASAGLEGARLVLHQSKDSGFDVSELKTSLLSDLYARSQQALEEKDKLIAALQQEQQYLAARRARLAAIGRELAVLYPEFQRVVVTEGLPQGRSAAPNDATERTEGPPVELAVNVFSKRRVDAPERAKILKWVETRVPQARALVVVQICASQSGAECR